jgi:hypothetical protein
MRVNEELLRRRTALFIDLQTSSLCKVMGAAWRAERDMDLGPVAAANNARWWSRTRTAFHDQGPRVLTRHSDHAGQGVERLGLMLVKHS